MKKALTIAVLLVCAAAALWFRDWNEREAAWIQAQELVGEIMDYRTRTGNLPRSLHDLPRKEPIAEGIGFRALDDGEFEVWVTGHKGERRDIWRGK